ncbi:unnamed protein product [Rhodiola kirilowii]
METITVSKSSFNGGVQQSKLNITEQNQISYNIASKQYNQDATFSSPYLSNSQKIPARQFNLEKCTVEDNEISIFDAQKYFNEGNEQINNQNIKPSPVNMTEQYDLAEFPRYSSVSSSVGTYSARNYGARSLYTTPTASSEASWNSQTGLLSNPPGTIKVSLRNLNPIVDEKRKNNSTRWLFGRNCPCIGKKSIQVDDKRVALEARSPLHFPSITPTNLSRETDSIPTEKSPAGKSKSTMPNTHQLATEKDRAAADQPHKGITPTTRRNFSEGAGFSFPILNPSITSQIVTTSKNQNSRIVEEPSRTSLEVFLPYNHETKTKTKTTKLIEDDAASDGSSDLFELESFSNQTTYQMYNNKDFRRDSLDEAANFRNPRRLSVITSTATNGGLYRRNSLEEPETPSVAPTEGYEPSEASIDWSVTTAEGFDRASVTTCEEMTQREDGGGRRNIGSRGHGLLGLSCRNEKAVLVGHSPGPLRSGTDFVRSIPGQQHMNSWAYNKPPLASRPNHAYRG